MNNIVKEYLVSVITTNDKNPTATKIMFKNEEVWNNNSRVINNNNDIDNNNDLSSTDEMRASEPINSGDFEYTNVFKNNDNFTGDNPKYPPIDDKDIIPTYRGKKTERVGGRRHRSRRTVKRNKKRVPKTRK